MSAVTLASSVKQRDSRKGGQHLEQCPRLQNLVPSRLILLLQVRASKQSSFVPQAEPGVDNDTDLYSDAEDMDEEA